MTRPTTLLASGLALLPFLGLGGAVYEAVDEGNRLYAEGQYEAALEVYASAAEQLPESVEIRFNLGDAWYRKHDTDQALEHYMDALGVAGAELDPMIESRIRYNVGVVKYRQAIQALQTFQDAQTLTTAAIGHFRASLRLDPGLDDARYNLELAYRLLDQIAEQKVQGQRNAETRNQETSDNSGQPFDDDAQDQETGERDAKPDSQQKPEGRRYHTERTNAKSESTTQIQEATSPKEMTPEAAEELLESLRERARAASSQRQQHRRARIHDAGVKKFW